MIGLLLFFSTFFIKPINLLTADLGRHLKNGEVFVNSWQALSTNLYSYTEPAFPVITHHWGSGVLFYIAFFVAGFNGVHILFALVMGAAVLFTFLTARRMTSFYLALFLSLLAIPLLRTRLEVRPEAFSYLFVAIFIYLFEKYRKGDITIKNLLFILLPIQLLWVNFHIFFVLGIFISFVYLRSINVLYFVLVSLINPFGIRGLLEPFNIFQEYGYQIIENQTIFFMHKRFPRFIYFYFEAMFLLFTFFTLVKFLDRKDYKEWEMYFISMIFGLMGFWMYRNVVLLPIVCLPLFSFFLKEYSKDIFKYCSFGLIFFFSFSFYPYSRLGLLPENQASINFYVENIKPLVGNVFNNYDIGGSLIFSDIEVFIDNRPEAYSVSFLKNVYIKMQEVEGLWEEKSIEYNLTSIFFYRHDATPWAQSFLIKRLRDPMWVPVYVDDFALIFVKDIDQYAHVINSYALPEEIFVVSPN